MYGRVYLLLMIALAATVGVVIYLVATGQRTLEPNYILLLAVFMLVVNGLLPAVRWLRGRRRPPRR